MVVINRLVALVLIAGAVPLWLMAGDFPGSASAFPRVVLSAIAVLAVILIGRSFLPAIFMATGGEGRRDLKSLGKPLAVFATALAAVISIPFFGFFPAMAAMAAIFMFFLGIENRRFYVIAMLVLLTMIYVVFAVALDVPLLNASLFE